jgi:vacuolar-type H+-ATPase subunit H
MREVIQKLLETETEASRLVEIAKGQAEAILANARKEAGELVARIIRDTRAEAEAIVSKAIADGEQAKQESLARASREIQAHVDMNPATRERVVAAAVRCVCGQDPP